MNSFVRAALRLWTDTGTSRLAMLRAKFAPITARPVTPIWLSSLMVRDLTCRARFATVLCHARGRAVELPRQIDGRRAARRGPPRPRRGARRPPGARTGRARAADRAHHPAPAWAARDARPRRQRA